MVSSDTSKCACKIITDTKTHSIFIEIFQCKMQNLKCVFDKIFPCLPQSIEKDYLYSDFTALSSDCSLPEIYRTHTCVNCH